MAAVLTPDQIADVLLDGVRTEGDLMLLRLLRTHLRPTGPGSRDRRAAVRQRVATLYLPSLNADIIDNGVVDGDTGYIVHTGAVMLGVSLLQIACSVARGLLRRPHRDGLRARRARRDLPPGRHLLPARAAALRRAVADHPQHQRRPAGADARADGLHHRGLLADHDGRRRHHGAARGLRAFAGSSPSSCPPCSSRSASW